MQLWVQFDAPKSMKVRICNLEAQLFLPFLFTAPLPRVSQDLLLLLLQQLGRVQQQVTSDPEN